MGYKWGTYTDGSFVEGNLDENAYTPYLVLPYELIRFGNAPFLKKKCIMGKDISQQMKPDNGSFWAKRKAITSNMSGYYIGRVLRDRCASL